MGRLKKWLIGIVTEDGFSAGIFHTSGAAGQKTASLIEKETPA